MTRLKIISIILFGLGTVRHKGLIQPTEHLPVATKALQLSQFYSKQHLIQILSDGRMGLLLSRFLEGLFRGSFLLSCVVDNWTLRYKAKEQHQRYA
jgi:hypothetical protein